MIRFLKLGYRNPIQTNYPFHLKYSCLYYCPVLHLRVSIVLFSPLEIRLVRAKERLNCHPRDDSEV